MTDTLENMIAAAENLKLAAEQAQIAYEDHLKVAALERERDEARAEVERLRAERDSAVAERAAYAALDCSVQHDADAARIAEARAAAAHEREVANEHLAQRHDAERERDEARAEVERLRASLRSIAEGFGRIDGSWDDPSAKQVDGYYRGFAVAALEKKP